jgi:FMN phosphatase YigB (HAD superfamily)
LMIGDNYETDIIGALNAKWKAIYFSETKKENMDTDFFQVYRLIDLKNML